MKCDMNCLKCCYKDCINQSNTLSEEELKFSNDYDKNLKEERRTEEIAQIDDPKKRAVARFRHTAKGKAMIHRRNTSELGKQAFKRYEQSEKGIARRKKFESKPERKAYMREYRKKYYAEHKEELNKKRTEYARKKREEDRLKCQ